MPFDPSLDLQKTIRARLVASAELIALVPAANILDVNARPERSPCIHIGEGQTIFRRFDATAYADLHIWVQEPGLVTAKSIASILVGLLTVDAQISGVLRLDHFICHDMRVTQTRFMRDPHGPYSHGIVNVAAIVQAL